MKIIPLNILLLLLSIPAYSQQTITITTGSKWTDVLVFNSTKPGHEHVPNTNHSTYPRLMASAWTQSGSPDSTLVGIVANKLLKEPTYIIALTFIIF
ncbi:MAG: hypothetical protein AAF149_20950 [Bacteroidota bacterium]